VIYAVINTHRRINLNYIYKFSRKLNGSRSCLLYPGQSVNGVYYSYCLSLGSYTARKPTSWKRYKICKI